MSLNPVWGWKGTGFQLSVLAWDNLSAKSSEEKIKKYNKCVFVASFQTQNNKEKNGCLELQKKESQTKLAIYFRCAEYSYSHMGGFCGACPYPQAF